MAPALAAERISAFCNSFDLRIGGHGSGGLNFLLGRGCRNIVLGETIRMIGGTSDGRRVDVRYLRCLVVARSCVDGATVQARRCGDASPATESGRRVVGLVDPDESEWSLEQTDGCREGSAERSIASTFVGDGVDQELWTAFLESRRQDVDPLSRLCAQPLANTGAASSRREERMSTRRRSVGKDGDVLLEAESRRCGREVVPGTSTSSSRVADGHARSFSAVEVSTSKSMRKRSRIGEVAPVRRSRRIAERSAVAVTGADSLPR